MENLPPPHILDRAWSDFHYSRYCPTNMDLEKFKKFIEFLHEICRIPIRSLIHKNTISLDKFSEEYQYFEMYNQTKSIVIIEFFKNKYFY